jgi:hypothetical protein
VDSVETIQVEVEMGQYVIMAMAIMAEEISIRIKVERLII